MSYSFLNLSITWASVKDKSLYQMGSGADNELILIHKHEKQAL